MQLQDANGIEWWVIGMVYSIKIVESRRDICFKKGAGQ